MAKKAAKKSVKTAPAKPAKKATRKKVPASKKRRGGSLPGVRKGSWAACSEEGAVLFFALVFEPVIGQWKKKKKRKEKK